ncbi:MAG: hypothetical protein JXA93_06675, partial [Anaerolineae bacterium]|nr:hypothetical protein [Anaerolineae bacterium]
LLWPFLLYLPLLFLAMTVAFTFPGTRGGLYHSGGALLPFILATTGPGLAVAVHWAVRRLPGWHAQRTWQIFAATLVATTLIVAVFALWRAGAFDGSWNRRDAHYDAIDRWIQSQGIDNPVVMVGDAPAFAWHTGQRAIAVPNEPLDTVVEVAMRYGAAYLLLDDTRPRTTDALYQGEQSDPRYELVCEEGVARLYAIRLR